MQALMNFKEDWNETIVGNEDIKEEIKDMLKNFHSNLLVLQQVVEVGESAKVSLAIFSFFCIDNSSSEEKSNLNQMNSHEQVSLFSRALEIIIRHALRINYETKMDSNQQLTYKPGSEFDIEDI